MLCNIHFTRLLLFAFPFIYSQNQKITPYLRYLSVKILWACIIMLLCTRLAFAQSADTDSLRNALYFAKDGTFQADTSTINTLNDLAAAYRFSELDTTEKYARIALQKAKEADFKKGYLFATYLLGTVHFNRGDYQQIYEIASAALDKAEPDKFPRERALLNQLIGLSYASQGQYEPGLNYFFKARNLFAALGDDNGSFQNLNNIGVSYLKLEDYKSALNIFLELDSLRTLEPATISIPVNLGFIYFELGEIERSEYHLIRVLNFEAENFDQRALGLSNFKLGEIKLLRQDYNGALDHFKRSIDVYEKMGNQLEKVQSLNGIAQTKLKQGNLSEAITYADQAFSIANKHKGLPETNTSAKTLYEIYKTTGDYDQALKFHELHKSLSDSLNNVDISREVGRLEAEYEYRERELELREAQQKQNIENARQVANRNTFILISLSLLLIAVVVAFAQHRNSKLRKKANELLRDKNEQIELQANKLQEMNEIKTHLFSIIAHDLRGPLSSLYGFITLNEMKALSVEQIEKMIPELAEKFKYTSNLLNNLLNWAKSQLEGYRVIPENFDLKTQFTENRKVLSSQANEKNVELIDHLPEQVQVYADKNMIGLVMLNLLSNAIKFTPEYGRIEASTEEKENMVQFSIKDNGIGISEDKLELLFSESSFYSTEGTNEEKGTGLGLILCKDFINRNGGAFWAESEEGKGSVFYFTIPKAK